MPNFRDKARSPSLDLFHQPHVGRFEQAPDLVVVFEVRSNHRLVQQRKDPGVNVDEAVLNQTEDSVGLANGGRCLLPEFKQLVHLDF